MLQLSMKNSLAQVKKKVLITGAGTGIGKDTAVALALKGHDVIATTETQEQAVVLREEFSKSNLSIEVWKLDVTLEEDREKVYQYDLDVLINNAAIGESGSLAEVPLQRVRNAFEVNLFSPLALTQIVLKKMMKKDSGTILFVSSLAGRLPMQFLNPYSMTKHALSSGVAALRQEIYQVTKKVHISLIEPGTYKTGFNQRMLAKKYEWMNVESYFYSLIPTLKKEENKRFNTLEQKSTASIVKEIIYAVDAKKPRLRYVAPRIQGWAVAFMRAIGK